MFTAGEDHTEALMITATTGGHIERELCVSDYPGKRKSYFRRD
jgi:hypothetical protein